MHKQKSQRTISNKVALVTICLLLAVIGGVKGCTKTSKTTTPPARVTVPAEKPWTFRTLTIPPGGLVVYLHQGCKGWPKGGAVIITTPDGRILRDQPGVDNDLGPGDGIFIFRADPEGSKRQVEILNRW